MKKSVILLPVILSLFVLYSFKNLQNQQNSPQSEPYLFLRVIECQGGDTANESMILIDRGNNKIEKVPLKKFHKKYFESNFKIISKTINDIKADGYKLISSSGGGGNDNAMILQNYIFEKK